MSNDDLITINADILQVTDAAVLIDCGGEEVWLPLSQIDFDGERGDANVSISLPEWLADEKGLSDGDGMIRATVTDFRTGLPKRQDDGKNCQNCAHCENDEDAPMPPECVDCTRSGFVGGTVDNWTDGGEATPDNDDKDDDETVPMPAEPAFLKTETITVSVPLAPEERKSLNWKTTSTATAKASMPRSNLFKRMPRPPARNGRRVRRSRKFTAMSWPTIPLNPLSGLIMITALRSSVAP